MEPDALAECPAVLALRPRLISVAEDAVLLRQDAEDGALAKDVFTRPASTTAILMLKLSSLPILYRLGSSDINKYCQWMTFKLFMGYFYTNLLLIFYLTGYDVECYSVRSTSLTGLVSFINHVNRGKVFKHKNINNDIKHSNNSDFSSNSPFLKLGVLN